MHNANVSLMQKQENEHKFKANPRVFDIGVCEILKGVGFFLHVSNELRLLEWGSGVIFFLGSDDGLQFGLCSECIQILLSEVLGRM